MLLGYCINGTQTILLLCWWYRDTLWMVQMRYRSCNVFHLLPVWERYWLGTVSELNASTMQFWVWCYLQNLMLIWLFANSCFPTWPCASGQLSENKLANSKFNRKSFWWHQPLHCTHHVSLFLYFHTAWQSYLLLGSFFLLSSEFTGNSWYWCKVSFLQLEDWCMMLNVTSTKAHVIKVNFYQNMIQLVNCCCHEYFT